jgi:hypothetical protein
MNCCLLLIRCALGILQKLKVHTLTGLVCWLDVCLDGWMDGWLLGSFRSLPTYVGSFLPSCTFIYTYSTTTSSPIIATLSLLLQELRQFLESNKPC